MVAHPIRDQLDEIAAAVEQQFAEERRVLAFDEYLTLFGSHPLRHSRDAGRYLRDAFDHYGTVEEERTWGKETRFRLFELEFLESAAERRAALAGHASVQAELYRVVNNFVREGRPNRVVLLHGPNGSAKSTIAACVMRALEHYSSLDEGALYRFHWVFPQRRAVRGAIGFRGDDTGAPVLGSYAHLPDEELDARLFVEVRDHPLFLLPPRERRALLERLYAEAGATEPPPEWVLRGTLSHKSRQVFDALLASYDGSLREVLRHVRVERYFISRRYRVGAVTLGPEIGVDATERQLTADRSVAALPTSLQSLSLYEAFGELVDAAGGVLEYSDLLKRPLDAFKYLQITAETGEVALRSQNLLINCVLLASGNELHLAAFREHPEFESFRGRLELIRVPYLRSYLDEQRIYDAQVAPQIERHVAPHSTWIAAMFAVFTRMRKPAPSHYEPALRALIEDLSAIEKADLYATGAVPPRLDVDAARTLRAGVAQLWHETDGAVDYEGRTGASPREMRSVLLDAAQDPRYDHLSPFAVLDGLDRLCSRVSEYAWLELDALPGAYHDHRRFREVLRERLLDTIEEDVREASGLVEEARHSDLFDRYLTHVSAWTAGERIRHPTTGDLHEADERLMADVERLIGCTEEPRAWRHSLLGRMAGWAIEHPGTPPDRHAVFQSELRRLREGFYAERREVVARATRDLFVLVRDAGAGLDLAQRTAAERMLAFMCEPLGYHPSSAADAAAMLLRHRYESAAG